MNIEEVRAYCINKAGTTESFPFDETSLVFKVGGKIYGILSLKVSDGRINLKCEPQYASELREKYDFIIPGYHMNKKHWNTIILEYSANHKDLVLKLIDHSYDLVYSSLSKKIKDNLYNS